MAISRPCSIVTASTPASWNTASCDNVRAVLPAFCQRGRLPSVRQTSADRLLITSPAGAEGAVEVERGADQRQVCERLREVPERLATLPSLLRIETEVVREAGHALEQEPRVVERAALGHRGPRQRLDEPEAAHVEGALAPRQAIAEVIGVVAVDEPVGDEAALAR